MQVLIVRARPVVLLVFVALAAVLIGGIALVNRGVPEIQVAGQEEKRPIYSVETDQKIVSLGINCAWDNADIPQLIKLLEQKKVRATFFVVGDWCDQYPESVKALYDAGHEIGTHSDTHADMAQLDQAGIIRELQDSAAKIEAITGVKPNLFRPPSGSYNSLVIQTAEQQGFYPIQWDCDSIDYRDPTADQMQQRIMKKLRCGSIMLFHSGAKNTPGALPQIIDAVRAQGYEFVPVSELVLPPPYVVDFEGRQHSADA